MAYGDADWIDRQRILREIRDPATAWDDSLRFYFNIRTVGAGRAVDPRVWDALANHQEVAAGTPVGIGFDGSNNRDATAIRACTADGYGFTLGIWQRPDDAPADWTVPRTEVRRVLDAAFKKYRVGRMFCDPWKWHSEIEDWAAAYGKDGNDDPVVVVLDTNQNSKFVPAVDRWLTAIREGTHTHDGDPMTADHVKSAHLKPVRLSDDPEDGRTRYRLEKGEERRLIDAAVADVLAYEAAMTMTVPKKREPRFRWA